MEALKLDEAEALSGIPESTLRQHLNRHPHDGKKVPKGKREVWAIYRCALEQMVERDWNDSQLARHIGVHRGTVGRWLKEGLLPEYPNMKKVADGLKVPLQQVIDAVEGNYQPMSQAEREAVEIQRKYSLEALRIACKAIEHMDKHGEQGVQDVQKSIELADKKRKGKE